VVIGARHLERQRARLRALAQEGAPPTQCALARQLDRAALGGQRPEEVIFLIHQLPNVPSQGSRTVLNWAG
jgi:hypothetical protein